MIPRSSFDKNITSEDLRRNTTKLIVTLLIMAVIGFAFTYNRQHEDAEKYCSSKSMTVDRLGKEFVCVSSAGQVFKIKD